MDDVRVYVDLPDHPKARALAARLEVALPHACGLLVCLWTWARTHARTGELPGASPSDLARWCRYDGDPETLVLALLASCPGHRRGFLEPLPGGAGFRLVGWEGRQPMAGGAHARDLLAHGLGPTARTERARKAGRASAARRAAAGWIRDERGRWRAPADRTTARTKPNSAPNLAPNDLRTNSTELKTTQVVVQQRFPPNYTELTIPNHQNPPPPRNGTGRALTGFQTPDHVGPKPPVSGQWLSEELDRRAAQLATLRTKASSGPLSARDRAAAVACVGFLRANGRDAPDLPPHQPSQAGDDPEALPL